MSDNLTVNKKLLYIISILISLISGSVGYEINDNTDFKGISQQVEHNTEELKLRRDIIYQNSAGIKVLETKLDLIHEQLKHLNDNLSK